MPERICMGREQAEEIINALDTAQGCLMLIANGRAGRFSAMAVARRDGTRITDLDACLAEITDAFDALVALVAEHSEMEEDED